MAAGERRFNESFEQYRERLRQEKRRDKFLARGVPLAILDAGYAQALKEGRAGEYLRRRTPRRAKKARKAARTESRRLDRKAVKRLRRDVEQAESVVRSALLLQQSGHVLVDAAIYTIVCVIAAIVIGSVAGWSLMFFAPDDNSAAARGEQCHDGQQY